MGFTTISGFDFDNTDANGLAQFTTGQPLTAESLAAQMLDLLQAVRYSFLPGVLAGGVCTASLLDVTIPAGTIYVAGGTVWMTSAPYTQSVADAATTYLWGQSDGLVGVSSSSTAAPTGFTRQTACLLTVAVAVAGTATVNNAVQEKAITANATNRALSLPHAMQFRRRSKALADANTTLTALEYEAYLLDFTGALTAGRDVILPLLDGLMFRVYNNTSGGFALTFKGATGTGEAVAAGKRAILECDGTNWYRTTLNSP